MATLTESQVKAKAHDWYLQRLRESGVSGLAQLANLSPHEHAIVARVSLEAQAYEAQLRGGAKMREGSRRVRRDMASQETGLIDLGDGVPTIASVTPLHVAPLIEAEAPDDRGLLALDGIPMVVGYDHAQASAAFESEFEPMRESADADDDALLDLGEFVPMREGTYGVDGGPQTYYEDAQTRQDVSDLYACVPELTPAGSPNLENSKLRGILENVEHGRQMSNVELATVRELLDKYADQVKALRASPDREGQDLHHVPDPSQARVVDRAEQDGEGLIDLGDLRKTPVAA